MNDSIQHFLERNRKPRVHIKYEVETEHGLQEKELPFVVGVIGDFSAGNAELPSLDERQFIPIDRDNFDQVMEKINPKLVIEVDNKLDESNAQLKLSLSFKSLKDFEPDQLVMQVDALRKLKLARDRLRELLTKIDCSESLEKSLENILKDQKQLLQLANDLQINIDSHNRS